MFQQIGRWVAMITTAVLLSGCVAAPQETPAPAVAGDPNDVPEITLNLPDKADCVCEQVPENDYTFLEKGFESVSTSDYVEAVQSFQRYQLMEKSASAQWESAVAIAYVSYLPNSPFYDPEAASKSYRQLRKQRAEFPLAHQQVLVMSESMEAFIALDRHVDDLEEANAVLKEDLAKREIGLKVLTQAIDTTSPGGRLVFHVFAAVAEFERELTLERTHAGLAQARALGRRGGRKPAMGPAEIKRAKAMLADPTITVEEVAAQLGVQPSTLYRHIPGGRSSLSLPA